MPSPFYPLMLICPCCDTLLKEHPIRLQKSEIRSRSIQLQVINRRGDWTRFKIPRNEVWSYLKAWTLSLDAFLPTLFGKRQVQNGRLFSFTLTFCDNTQIKKLNTQYRKKNRATDVLSFPVHENLRLAKNRKLLPTEVLLGDLFISLPYAQKQAKEFDLTSAQEIVHLATHGLLHLWGFDHEISPKEEKIMQQYEAKLLKLMTRIKQKE